ncbi:hypothetical protein ES705_34710 [subsurface metagenome]
MWRVVDKKMSEHRYIETWGDSTGYVRVYETAGGMDLIGKVKRGREAFFYHSIKRQYPNIRRIIVEEIEEDNEEKLNLLDKEIKQIVGRNKKNIEEAKEFPYEV